MLYFRCYDVWLLSLILYYFEVGDKHVVFCMELLDFIVYTSTIWIVVQCEFSPQ